MLFFLGALRDASAMPVKSSLPVVPVKSSALEIPGSTKQISPFPASRWVSSPNQPPSRFGIVSHLVLAELVLGLSDSRS